MDKSFRKIMTLSGMKLKANFANKMTLISPLFAVAMMMIIYMGFEMNGVKEIPNELKAMALNFGLLFNFMLTGVTSTSTLLSEEKEKHTLRSLLTSSLSSTEFFLGSVIPNVLIVMVVNVILLFISRIPLSQINIPVYLLVTLLGSVISVVLGMFVGIFAKNQMSASLLSMPVLLIISSGSFIGNLVPGLKKVTQYFYTEIVNKMSQAFALNQSYSFPVKGLLLMILQLAIAIALVFIVYKKNGYESD